MTQPVSQFPQIISPIYGNGPVTADGSYRPKEDTTHEKTRNVAARVRHAKLNYQMGTQGTNDLDGALLAHLASSYLNVFFEEDNPWVGWVRKSIDAVSQFFVGHRDKSMYSVYGHGADVPNLTEDEMRNPDEAIESGKTEISDDFAENLLVKPDGEWFINKLWKWSNDTAKVKMFLYPINAFLPTGMSNIVNTVFEMPARALWRCRFFIGSIAPDFCSKMLELVGYGTMRLFNKDYDAKYNSSEGNFRQKIESYFKHRNEKYGDKYDYQNLSTVSLVSKFIFARHAKHWRDVFNPEAALKEKVSEKIISGSKLSDVNIEESKRMQRLSSLADLTGPLCAGLGLVGSAVLDPVHSVMTALGVEKGRSIVKAFSDSRMFLQSFNYMFRIVWPEGIFPWDKSIKDLKNSAENDPNATEVSKLYYRLEKGQMRNTMIGVAMTMLSGIMPMVQLFKMPQIEESKIAKFLFKALQGTNWIIFLRFLSRRRSILGLKSHLKNLTVEELAKQGKNVEYSEIKGSHYKLVRNLKASDLLPGVDGIENYIGTGSIQVFNKFMNNIKDSIFGCVLRSGEAESNVSCPVGNAA